MRIFTPSLYFQCVFNDFQRVITLLRALSVALQKKTTHTPHAQNSFTAYFTISKQLESPLSKNSTGLEHYCSDWEGKGPCTIVPLTWKMAHKSLCRMIRNGPLKISKSLKKAENGPIGKNLFPITATGPMY